MTKSFMSEEPETSVGRIVSAICRPIKSTEY